MIRSQNQIFFYNFKFIKIFLRMFSNTITLILIVKIETVLQLKSLSMYKVNKPKFNRITKTIYTIQVIFVFAMVS